MDTSEGPVEERYLSPVLLQDQWKMNARTDPPPGPIPVPPKRATLLIPERVYVAGLKLGKLLRRAENERQWLQKHLECQGGATPQRS